MTKTSLTAPIPLPKPVKITFRVVLGIIAALLLAWLIVFFVSTRVTFKYVNGSISPENEQNYEINFPFFGNSAILADGPYIYNVPIYLGDMAIVNLTNTYGAVNDPIFAWTNMLRYVHDSRGNINYTVEESGGNLTVHFTGVIYDESGAILENIDKEFVFDVKGASMKNAPKWTNRTADDDYYMNREYLK